MKDLTIIIPTHYRHKYLSRILEYYKDADCRLIVLDSTNIKYQNASKWNSKVEYYHFPDMTLISKLVLGLKKIENEYCLICADDDFITPNGINFCLRFLRNNLDYDSAEGSYIGFRFLEDQQIQLRNIYEYARAFDYNGETGLARAQQVFQNYMPFFYSVHRSKNLLDNFKLFNNSGMKNLYLMELFSILFLIMRGKHKVLPVFYSARESMQFKGYKMDTAYDIFKLNKNPKELETFISILSQQYASFDNISISEAEKGINSAIDMYCEFFFKYTGKEKSKSVFDGIVYFKNKVSNKLRKIFNIKKNIIGPNNSIKKLTTSTGYEVHEDWLKIEKVIKFHGIMEEPPKKESILIG